MPFVVETCGAISKVAYSFAKKLVHRMVSRDFNAAPNAFQVQFKFFLQRLSVAVQSSNADVVLECCERRSHSGFDLADIPVVQAGRDPV